MSMFESQMISGRFPARGFSTSGNQRRTVSLNALRPMESRSLFAVAIHFAFGWPPCPDSQCDNEAHHFSPASPLAAAKSDIAKFAQISPGLIGQLDLFCDGVDLGDCVDLFDLAEPGGI